MHALWTCRNQGGVFDGGSVDNLRPFLRSWMAKDMSARAWPSFKSCQSKWKQNKADREDSPQMMGRAPQGCLGKYSKWCKAVSPREVRHASRGHAAIAGLATSIAA